MIITKQIETPVGIMRMAANDKGICLFDFAYRRLIDPNMRRIEKALNDTFEEGEHHHFKMLEKQLDEYFAGSRQEFDLPLLLLGTPFQKQVWNALLRIPYGETRSYKQQSISISNEKAIRAVGTANGENAIAIIIPCHRVVGANGSLTGYGGGLPKKKWLLEHEWKHSGKSNQLPLFDNK